jgi:cell division protein FtsN
VTNEQLKQAAKEKGTRADPEGELKDNYFLQAGAFQSPADADNMKAKLAFLGLESSVEPTNIPEKGVFYRVRLGPYNRIDDINRVRTQLAQNGIEPSLVKVRDARNP